MHVATLAAICHLDRALTPPYWEQIRRPDMFIWWTAPYEECIITLDNLGQLTVGIDVNGQWMQKELGSLPTELHIRAVLTELRIVPGLDAIINPEDGLPVDVEPV